MTLSDLERAVGMTKGTFYYHFTNKEEVLKEGISEYYRLLNRKRTEEFEQIHSLREFIDVTIRHLLEIDNYSAKSFDSDIPEILCLSLLVEVAEYRSRGDQLSDHASGYFLCVIGCSIAIRTIVFLGKSRVIFLVNHIPKSIIKRDEITLNIEIGFC